MEAVIHTKNMMRGIFFNIFESNIFERKLMSEALQMFLKSKSF